MTRSDGRRGGPPRLVVDGLTAGYDRHTPVITDVSLTVAPGEVVLVIGPNGSGKSTLLKSLAGLTQIHAGDTEVDGSNLRGVPTMRLHQRGVGYVPQTENVFPSLTVLENVNVGASAGADVDALASAFPIIGDKSAQRAGSLSGGERQFLAIARAMALSPRLLLVDEPSAGVDPATTVRLMGLLRQLADDGTAVLLVEQDVHAALEIADWVYVLTQGRNRLSGNRAHIESSSLEDVFFPRPTSAL